MKDNQILSACESEGASAPARNSLRYVLVVEDDDSLRQLSTEALVHSGYEVDAAADGAVAWDKLQHNRYDLLVTDNKMPKVSGVELLKKMRAACMTTPTVMVTGALPEAEFDRFPSLRPAATLLKPFTVEEMLQLVRTVLRGAVSHSIAPRPRPAHSARRILVVDGDHDLRWLYAEALAGRGCRVDTAADGVAGWEALQDIHYDLLITEHDVPKLTGVELVTKLRAARMTLPVVMAAGRMPVHELTRNPSLQLAATLSKPFAVEELLETVENVLSATEKFHDQIAPTPSWRNQPAVAGLRL